MSPRKVIKTTKGHPLRQARRARADERIAAHVCNRTCKRFRTGKAKWKTKATDDAYLEEADHALYLQTAE